MSTVGGSPRIPAQTLSRPSRSPPLPPAFTSTPFPSRPVASSAETPHRERQSVDNIKELPCGNYKGSIDTRGGSGGPSAQPGVCTCSGSSRCPGRLGRGRGGRAGGGLRHGLCNCIANQYCHAPIMPASSTRARPPPRLAAFTPRAPIEGSGSRGVAGERADAGALGTKARARGGGNSSLNPTFSQSITYITYVQRRGETEKK